MLSALSGKGVASGTSLIKKLVEVPEIAPFFISTAFADSD
jgi:hypothetical protein